MTEDQELIDRIRSFNRFYTNFIGLLDQHFLDSPFSLTEGRVLYEICNIEECSAKKIREKIDVDNVLGRIDAAFEEVGVTLDDVLRTLPAARERIFYRLYPNLPVPKLSEVDPKGSGDGA